MSSSRCSRSGVQRPTLSRLLFSLCLVTAALSSCTPCEPIAPLKPDPPPTVAAPPPPTPTGPTEADARAFMDQTETQLRALWSYAQRVQFIQNTNITVDTEQLNAMAQEQVMELVGKKIKEAAQFDKLQLAPELRRKFDLLKLAQDLPSPPDASERAELAQLAASMETSYGKAKYCPPRLKGGCLTIDDLSRTLATSRSYDELLEAWTGWHDLAKTLRGSYVRYVVLANKGAQNAGYPDVGAMWRSRYDMSEAAFAAETERLWEQVRPLYEMLHCYTRMKLRQTYGNRVPETGAIPAHLLGNMWAQEWGNIFPLVAQAGKGQSINLKAKFQQKKTTPLELVKMGESFFKSVGFDALPDSFWKRSMFVRPKDREVVCHASAWDITSRGDLRIKMCIELDDDNFRTVHHELGHDYYYWYYRDLPLLFQQGANDGFHEAIGDAIALSITPSYLQKIGLADQGTQVEDTTFLLHDALEHVAFLPFGKVLDQWRWEVFSGKVKPEDYNKRWWELRTKYQGVAPPIARTDADFDPGAKYHIPSNVPYARYFLARILEFQFHRALCQAAGFTGPLHKCSIYGNQAAGDKMKTMLQMGSSKPWPEALEAIAGTQKMDGAAMLDYYAPLITFLKDQTKSQKCGW